MQSLLFVFIGLPEKNSDAYLSILKLRLNEKFGESKIPICFSQKNELLTAKLDDTSFYISFLKSKDELNDWYEMAGNFELKIEKKPINSVELLKRYATLENSSTNPYQKIHFTIGLNIIEEMERIMNITIYSFQ